MSFAAEMADGSIRPARPTCITAAFGLPLAQGCHAGPAEQDTTSTAQGESRHGICLRHGSMEFLLKSRNEPG